MILSEAFPVTIKGKPAQLRVIRNNGSCWGRLILPNGYEFDLYTRKDWYDQTDEEARDAFLRAFKRGNVEQAPEHSHIGWAGPRS